MTAVKPAALKFGLHPFSIIYGKLIEMVTAELTWRVSDFSQVTTSCFKNKLNPVSRVFALMRTNVNLLNRVPEHDYPAFFVLNRTKCERMHSEWERFLKREREREIAQIVQCTL